MKTSIEVRGFEDKCKPIQRSIVNQLVKKQLVFGIQTNQKVKPYQNFVQS